MSVAVSRLGGNAAWQEGVCSSDEASLEKPGRMSRQKSMQRPFFSQSP